MAVEGKSPYELLGVGPAASDREIRRAYRRRVVTTHRSGVLGLVEQLEELGRAYEALKNPSRRRAIEAAAGGAPAGYSASSRSEAAGTTLGVRSEAAREIQRHSVRIGREAHRDNAATVRAISDDYDRGEAALRRTRRREARFRIALRVFWLAVLVALAVFAMLRWQPA